ncbi:MAG: glutathione S-transferase family protein [Pseudomonadota bacterium]
MSDVTILGLPPSSYVRTALMACANKGLKYTLQPVDFRSDSYLSEHPFRKMPVLHHGKVKLYETLSIATYVDAAFEGPALQPAAPVRQARMMQWISVTNDYLYASIVGCCVAERFVKPMRGLDPDVALIAKSMPVIEGHLDVLDAALDSSDFFAGDQVSLADLFVAPVLAYFAATPEGVAALPNRGALQAWLARMQSTPQFDEINKLGP